MAEAEQPTELKATVNVNKDGMSTRQWIAVIGLGTVLLPGIVGWMMYWMNKQTTFMQTTIQTNTSALTSVKDQSEDVEGALRSTARALNKVAEVIGKDDEAEAEQ